MTGLRERLAIVGCLACHLMTNPDGSEHAGVQNVPFIASTDGEGHYGSGQYVMNDADVRLGPYADTDAKHDFLKSNLQLLKTTSNGKGILNNIVFNCMYCLKSLF